MAGPCNNYINKMGQTACNTSTQVIPASGTTAGAQWIQVFAYTQDVFLEPGAAATSTSPIVVKAGQYAWIPHGPGYYAIAQTSGGFVSAVWWGGS